MRAKRNPQYDEMFLGGLVGKLGKPGGLGGRVRNFAEKRPGLSKAIGLGGGLLANKAMGNKGAGLFPKMSGAGLVGMLRDRMQQRRSSEEVPQAEYGAMVKKYRAGGMIYAQDSDAVTLPDGSAEKEKRFVQSVYGSGEDRITETDIRANRSLDPFEEYGGYVIKGDHYGKTRQAVGFHPKKMDTPGYFLVQGYTDEEQMRNVERGRPDATQQYVMEVLPGGGKRVMPLRQVMDEFTSGKEDEGLADVLEAMDINVTRTDKGFSLPSREDQIQTLLKRRENYGLGDIGFKELLNELGLNVPEMEEGEYKEALERALAKRAAGQVTQAKASGQR